MVESKSNSPVAVALAGFAPGVARVLAWDASDTLAFVVLDVGPPEYCYAYAVWLEKRGRDWEEGSSGNAAGGWMPNPGEESGMVVVWEELPEETDLVRVEFAGSVREVEAQNGIFLATWKGVPRPDDAVWPRAIAFRARGKWRPFAEAYPLLSLLNRGHAT